MNKKKTAKVKLSDTVIQDLAARSMMGLLPGFEPGAKLPEDFDIRYDLIYSAANQTELKFQGNIGIFKSPIEMRLGVEHDPSITRNEIGYNFKTCKYTIYTPISDSDLDELVFDPKTAQEQPRNDVIVKSFGDIIPAALLKYFTTQAEVMSTGNEEQYMDTFLPDQFNSNKGEKK